MPSIKKSSEQKAQEQAERLAIAYDKMIEYAKEIKELNCENIKSISDIGVKLQEAYQLFKIIKTKNLNRNIDEYIDRVIKIYENIWELYAEANDILIEICKYDKDVKYTKDVEKQLHAIKYKFNTKLKLIQIHIDLSKDIFLKLWNILNFGLAAEGILSEVADTPSPIHDPYATGGKSKNGKVKIKK